MKVQNSITNYFNQSDELLSNKVNFDALEKTILKKTAQPKIQTKRSSLPIFAFMSLLLVLIAGYFYFNTQIKPVSAQEVLQNAIHGLKEKFSYTAKTVYACSTKAEDYDMYFKNESGTYEDSPTTRKRIAECQKNNGKLFYTRKVWVDQTNNAVRIEDSLAPWDLVTNTLDKQGRTRTGTANPVMIKRGDEIYSLYIFPEQTTPDGTHPGLYVKINKKDWQNSMLSEQLKGPRETLIETLTRYKNDKNFTVVLSEITENGKEYYKLSFSETKKHHLMSEQFFEKNTYRPAKTISYDEVGKVLMETTYQDFTTTVNSDVFSITKAPVGYSFIEGKINSFDINSYCDTCYFGNPARYRITPLTLLTKDGQELDIPGMGGGRMLLPLQIKVFESTQRFNSQQEVENADGMTFTQLKETNTTNSVEQTLDEYYFLSNTKIGTDKQYSRLKIEIYDMTGKTKQNEVLITANIMYDSARLPDQGSLRFQHISKNSQVQDAMYTWKNNSNILIDFQKPILMSDDLCGGYRTDSIPKTNCSVKKEDGVTEATVINEHQGKKSTRKDWWRTDLIYGNTFVTIQFRSYVYDEKKCGKSDQSPYNEIEPDCLQYLVRDDEKKQVVAEVKKLIKKLDSVWK